METTVLATYIQKTIQATFGDCGMWKPEERDSDVYLTRKLKEATKELGHRLGYDVRSSDRETWEFLYDICFLATKNPMANYDGYFRPDNYILHLALALECEWSPQLDEIVYDFSKLLLAHTPLKVMMCYQGTIQGVYNPTTMF